VSGVIAVAGSPAVQGEPSAPSQPTPAPSTPAPASGMEVYRNTTYHWSITYPNRYTIDTTKPDWISLKAFEPPGEVGIHSFLTDKFTSLDEMASWQLDYFRQYFSARNLTLVVVSRRRITLPNNISAVDVIREMMPADGDRANGGRSHDIYVLAGQRLFILSAETYIPAWDAVAKEFDQILNSFTVEQPD
jgi:hypothetical protein